MTKKQKVARRAVGLSPLLTPHLYWKSDPPDAFHLLRILALHYRVYGAPLGEDFYPKPSNNDGFYQLLLELAGELYPAFEKPPSKGGRPRRPVADLLHPLAWYPNADAARLVQLVAQAKEQRKQRGDSAKIGDICNDLVRRYAGKYPDWRYNGLRSGASLKRHAWDKISKEVKAHPERFLPAPAYEPTRHDGRPYLPPLHPAVRRQ